MNLAFGDLHLEATEGSWECLKASWEGFEASQEGLGTSQGAWELSGRATDPRASWQGLETARRNGEKETVAKVLHGQRFPMPPY